MGVLNVVDGVLVTAGQCQIYIEGELRSGGSRDQKIPGGVAADPVNQVAKRDVATGALREFHLGALAHNGHHLMQHILRPALGYTHVESLQSGSDAGNGAVMIGALLIDHALIAALPFVVVIGDIWDEVGIPALTFAHHAILIIAKFSGAQPQCILLFIGMTGTLQGLYGLLDGTAVIE